MASLDLTGEALRAEQVRILKSPSILHLTGVLAPHVSDVVPDVDPEPPYADAYGELARKLYASFHYSLADAVGEEADLINGENAVSGFDAMARILSFGPVVYTTYCQSHNKAARVEELAAIMKESYDSVHFLMNISGPTNNALEQALGISGGQTKRPTDTFVIIDTEQGARFVPSDKYLQEATSNLRMGQDPSGTEEPWKKCPARGLFGLTLWRHMVDLAASDPAFFAADLTRAQNQT
ncbi:MAG TPA: hypothetical protein VM124_03650 [Candidatus Limnocylindrales bacterium]|nr:hypothetical protein [Candidatus Limnocylindrales bacterium]